MPLSVMLFGDGGSRRGALLIAPRHLAIPDSRIFHRIFGKSRNAPFPTHLKGSSLPVFVETDTSAFPVSGLDGADFRTKLAAWPK
jgi:hypothetical protein